MKTERVILALLVLTLATQGFTLYRQFASPQSPPIVRDAPEGTFLDISGLPMRGSSDAKIVLVEFSDYECPFCARHASGAGKEISKQFVASGKVRHAFVNNPLDIHPNAVVLAAAAICVGEQGHYWEMHDALFEMKSKNAENALALTSELPTVNKEALERCLDAPETDKKIELDKATAKAFDLLSTPSFGIGRIEKDGRLRILKFVRGAQPFQLFESEINRVLNDAS